MADYCGGLRAHYNHLLFYLKKNWGSGNSRKKKKIILEGNSTSNFPRDFVIDRICGQKGLGKKLGW